MVPQFQVTRERTGVSRRRRICQNQNRIRLKSCSPCGKLSLYFTMFYVYMIVGNVGYFSMLQVRAILGMGWDEVGWTGRGRRITAIAIIAGNCVIETMFKPTPTWDEMG